MSHDTQICFAAFAGNAATPISATVPAQRRPMHYEDIKAAIRKKGVTPSQIAQHLGVSDSIVSVVIRGTSKSERVAKAIAGITGHTLEELWPGRYGAAPKPGVSELLSKAGRRGSTAVTRSSRKAT